MNIFSQWPTMGSTGEAVLFTCVAVVMVGCALGVLFFKKAAYAAICMVGVMLGLAVLYITLGAPFLGTVQVVVYTGAIMMLFLFVIMMIGVGASDEYPRQGRGRIVVSVLIGLALVLMVGGAIANATVGDAKGFDTDPYSNEPITTLAVELFSQHWFTMELAGILLITAAIAAMLLTHTDRLGPKIDQRAITHAKMRAYKKTGRRLGQLPSPGVYAHSNSADVPAVSGETLAPVEESVPRVLRVRGLDRSLAQVEPEVAASLALERQSASLGTVPTAHVERSRAWGMPGPAAPTGLRQLGGEEPSTDEASAEEENK